jgi:transcriptional regulator|nr:MAG TPA: Helix-turn-helix XRE-family like protein [Caudoviricetes sp.]DAX85110.1 MAG TPA: Helix-turn-helix XRE-family like protein [Caudoviricetes sp.]
MMYRIKEKRIEKNLSQEELAEKAGISRITISMLESGRQQDIKVSTIKRIANSLECPISDLIC